MTQLCGENVPPPPQITVLVNPEDALGCVTVAVQVVDLPTSTVCGLHETVTVIAA